MDLGFETIGNATLICHDGGPVLVTDPWLVGSAYFGSWGLSHEVPPMQMEAARACRFVWLSHGHPDHLSLESLAFFTDKVILLPDHVGNRIRLELEELGFRIQVMPDRVWTQLSPRIRALSIADFNQDAVLLVDVGGKLVVNLNDANDRAWGGFVRRTVRDYRATFLLSLAGYGDADMINYFTEDGRRIPPLPGPRAPLGPMLARRAETWGTRYVVPFSSMHRYQRTDSIWASEHTAPITDYARGFDSRTAEILPAFLRYDCVRDDATAIGPQELAGPPVSPSEFGDDWSEPLERAEVDELRRYIGSITHLPRVLDFIRFRVGGQAHAISLRRGHRRGVTFDVPRGSLLKAVRTEVFDDLLIGNFMKATLHGNLPRDSFRAGFTPYVGKYADNGRAKTDGELATYFAAYRRRDPVAFLRHRVHGSCVRQAERAADLLRRILPRDSRPYLAAKRAYWAARRAAG